MDGRMMSRRISGATWGAMLVWLGVTMVATFDNARGGVTMIGFGAILLISAAVRRITATDDASLSALIGALLLAFGIYDFAGITDAPVIATIVIVAGIMMLLGAFRKPPVKKPRTPEAPPTTQDPGA